MSDFWRLRLTAEGRSPTVSDIVKISGVCNTIQLFTPMDADVGTYLLRHAPESSCREDNRGDPVSRVAALMSAAGRWTSRDTSSGTLLLETMAWAFVDDASPNRVTTIWPWHYILIRTCVLDSQERSDVFASDIMWKGAVLWSAASP